MFETSKISSACCNKHVATIARYLLCSQISSRQLSTSIPYISEITSAKFIKLSYTWEQLLLNHNINKSTSIVNNNSSFLFVADSIANHVRELTAFLFNNQISFLGQTTLEFVNELKVIINDIIHTQNQFIINNNIQIQSFTELASPSNDNSLDDIIVIKLNIASLPLKEDNQYKHTEVIEPLRSLFHNYEIKNILVDIPLNIKTFLGMHLEPREHKNDKVLVI